MLAAFSESSITFFSRSSKKTPVIASAPVVPTEFSHEKSLVCTIIPGYVLSPASVK
jgi:hypothetical protein